MVVLARESGVWGIDDGLNTGGGVLLLGSVLLLVVVVVELLVAGVGFKGWILVNVSITKINVSK